MSELIKFGPVSSKLLEMREALARPGGWCQGAFYRDGAHCLVGAADPKCKYPNFDPPVRRAISEEIGERPACWNDSLPPGREGQLIVCEMLERAALREARAGR